jgi:broad specificity phosphatase PhoE
MEIALARHGRPKLAQRDWITPRQLADWIRAYNAAGIYDDNIPLRTSTRAVDSGIIVTSPLIRCMQSARLLAPLRDIETEELIREAGIPYANWVFPRLPVPVWTILFRVAWFCGYSSNSESLLQATSRARSATDRLIDLAQQHQSVFVMGHGVMTALIAKQLVRRGWSGPKRPAHKHWQYCIYAAAA